MLSILNNYYIKETNKGLKKEIIPYGVRMVGAPLEWKETMGKGIKIGVIDTGIDSNHIDLRDRIAEYKNFTNEDLYDYNGHGTHVAGTIAASYNNTGVVGVAPEAELYIAKAFFKDGATSEGNIIKAVSWLCDKEVDIINMSFSSKEYTKDYENILNEATGCGITMVAAAGNESDKGIGYPALYENTICVAAVDNLKRKPEFSSIGKRVDVSAAGVDIYSTYPNNKYALLSGTSMATPIIAGAAAILQSKAIIRFKRKLNPKEIKLLLQMYSDDLGSFGKDDLYGYGLFSFGRIDTDETIRR